VREKEKKTQEESRAIRRGGKRKSFNRYYWKDYATEGKEDTFLRGKKRSAVRHHTPKVLLKDSPRKTILDISGAGKEAGTRVFYTDKEGGDPGLWLGGETRRGEVIILGESGRSYQPVRRKGGRKGSRGECKEGEKNRVLARHQHRKRDEPDIGERTNNTYYY